LEEINKRPEAHEDDDEDGGGGEAAPQLSLSSNSIDSPINDDSMQKYSRVDKGNIYSKTTHDWNNLNKKFESRESLASQILN